ncbi:MAG: hypothetical protein A2W93_03800 [Bacteroidetes bacterium GWF2_43_63]|nr:MAG: hypothetical protein A2W94_15900 [Bacteroidetes bacterium GWE2_42_42]OFY55350.1 MAG: hypothetical protein A2W93_03800 [Bacteroidetes bacterium GWF2_43_63]HBG71879.1 hypothetical protein [Bacteroidales bacterium]HCB61779.1 hypothetical protein [Bacteroidales bacterium]HCY22625.1 hypothetical protein [Bacteroidales bacterium]
MIKCVAVIFFFLIAELISAQSPTVQDCMGAIPVCQYVYTQTNSFSGEGNYPDEINTSGCPASCLESGEKNDVWYIFTVQTSGLLKFNITPNNSQDDYDWAVYNLTNANCNNIYTNPSLQVSCNYAADPGTTGANGGSSLNCADALDVNDNAAIPVTAGQTYVLNISNFSSTQYGYTLNFSASSASIFDNIPPVFQSVNQPIACGSTQLTFTFSENVLCSTASVNDFNLFGPGGPYSITGITGAACAAGGSMENTFTITVSPAIMASGSYQICLNNTAGSVTDNCGNQAAPACFNFSIQNISTNISVVDADCGPNGSATVSATGGSGSYSYTWSTVPVQSTQTATGLGAGSYFVTVSDGQCSAIDTALVIDIGGPTLNMSGNPDYCGQGLGTASVVATGGSGIYTYIWDTNPASTNTSVSGLTTGTYSVTVDDGGLCPGVASYIVQEIAGPELTIVSSTPELYGMFDGTATVAVSGGTGSITVVWNTNPPVTGTAITGLAHGTYIVVATDSKGCTDTIEVVVGLTTNTYLTVSTTPDHCKHGDGTATVHIHNAIGNTAVEWNTTPLQTTETITGLISGGYLVTMTDSIGTYTNIAYVYNAPGTVAAFSANPNPVTIGSPIQFINQSINADLFFWDFGDGDNSLEEFPIHTYGSVGEFTVWLVAQDSYDCKDTTGAIVIINDIFTFYIPSAFSPNGDGINDFFMPYGISVNTDLYEMRIYNRWGSLVFFTSDYNVPWDGNVNGVVKKEKIQDTYTYEIIIKDATQLIHKYRGSVTLLY